MDFDGGFLVGGTKLLKFWQILNERSAERSERMPGFRLCVSGE